MDEKIHVIAVGENPLEMILSPFELLRPDMVYVLIPSNASPDQEPFHAIAEKLTTFLRSATDLHWIKVDFSDLKSILLSIAWIFGREKQRKNKVFVNLALGGSKVAVGLTISCCLFHGEPYYITTDPSTHIVSFPYIVEWLALRPYDLPTMNQIRILDLIQQGHTRPTDLIRLAAGFDSDFVHSGKSQAYPLSRHFNLVQQRYIHPLTGQGYISITPEKKITLSAMGDLYATALVAYLKAMESPEE